MSTIKAINNLREDTIFRSIIDSPFFQRLKKIKQLGFVYLDWSDSLHTRYEHSIGSAEIAYRIALSVGLPQIDSKKLSYAAALHEVGMSPYSYSITEDICKSLDYNKMDMCSSLIAQNFSDILGEHTDEIIDIVLRKHGNELYDQIIFGLVGANTLDYLTRDSLHTIPIFSNELLETILSRLTISNKALVLKAGYKDLYLMIHGAKKIMNHNIYFSPRRRTADMMLSAAMRDSIDKGTASQIANAFKNNALFLNMDDDSFLEMMNFATQGTPHHDIVVMLSSGLIYESLDITHFVLTNFAQYMEKPSLVRIIHEFIYDILQIDGSRFIIDSPLNYIVRFHGEAYTGESSFNYSLPQELLSFTDLFAEPAINRKRKNALRTQSQWMIYYHPEVAETINKHFSDNE